MGNNPSGRAKVNRMNIKEAKTEIQNTLRAYLRKDSEGKYLFPVVRQRPILLMGPPGIGKTAILEQIAQETNVGLVPYTMTHHTRQSAIGLPHIEVRNYDGQEMRVTEYTMSEIVASVYEYMNRTGKREGILFLDEVNCVSETLAPTMLQLLQNKTFGNHRIPDGWILVAAGNPPQYNKSVREFDVATLDRVRCIPVEADCGIWLEYATARHIHGAILSYLAIRPEHFYVMESKPDHALFVTARGWEDLSEILKSYESLGIPVKKSLTSQYLQKDEVASSFSAYYQMYRKYDSDYGITQLLTGSLREEQRNAKIEMARNGGFEERFTVIQLLMDALAHDFAEYSEQYEFVQNLHSSLLRLRSDWGEGVEALAAQKEKSLQVLMQSGLTDSHQQHLEKRVIRKLREYALLLKKDHIWDAEKGFSRVREYFSGEVALLEQKTDQTADRLKRAFSYVRACFEDGQEMVLFVTDLSRSPQAMAFIAANGSEDFLRHSSALQFRKQEQTLMEACRNLLNT